MEQFLTGKSIQSRKRPVVERSQRGVAYLTIETYAMRLVTLGLMIVSAVLQARLLGPEGKGLLAAALSWSALIGGVALVGLDSAALYFVARSAQYTRWIVRAGLVYALSITLIASALLSLWIDGPGDRRLMLLVMLLTPIFVLMALFNAVCAGLKRIRLTNVINAIAALCYVLVLSVFSVTGIDRFEAVAAAVTAVQVLSLILLAAALRRISNTAYVTPDVPALTHYAVQSFRGNLAGLLFLRSSLVILSSVSPPVQAGIYSIATVFVDVVLMLPNTLINILLPRLAGRSAAFVAERVAMVARHALAGALVLGLLVGSFAFVVVPAGFGEAFRQAAVVALVLCIGAAPGIPGAMLSMYFNALEQPGIPATAAWIGCGVLITGSLMLAPPFGALGAAVAVVIARTAMSLFMITRFCSATRLNWHTLVFQAADWSNGERRIATIYEQIVRTRRA